MDAWARMFQEEADTLAFLLNEEFMEDIMITTPAVTHVTRIVRVDFVRHDDEHPFCDNPDCPCHGDPETFQLVDQPYKDGLLTSQEAERLFLGRQV